MILARISLALLGLVTLTTAAQARPRAPIKLSSDVVSVTTITRDDVRLRAIVAEERGATALQIERLVQTRRGWVTDDVARYDTFMVGDRVLDTRTAHIENVDFRRRVVAFDLIVGERLSCRARLEKMRGTEIARCESRWDDDEAWERPQPRPDRPDWPDRPDRHDHPGNPGHPDRPRPVVNWAASPAVIRACSDAFIGSSSQQCMEIVSGFNSDPLPVIKSCEEHLVGDASGLECLRKTASFFGNPASVVDACDDAMVGDSSTLQCIDAARNARVDPAPAVRACGEASVGDSAALQCIRRALGN